jgi:streptomycin 6-kinase
MLILHRLLLLLKINRILEETKLFIIPDNFARFMIELFGEEGRSWLDRLPAILAACEERWNMKIGAPVGNLSFNYVAPAVLAGGTEVMLKVGLTDEFPSQPEALRHFDGHGMVQLLAYDEHDAAMLMERLKPGTSLRLVEDDEAAISAAAEVMRKIGRPLPPQHYPFPTINDWGKGFTRLRKLYDGGTGPIPSARFDKAEQLYAELSASMDEPVLLHGDLHQDNILSAEREPWLAVDPKGLIGEPAYETGAILRNFWPDILAIPDPVSLMKRRIDQLSAELGFDRERIYNWGFAQAVLSVIWGVEDTGRAEDEGLFFVEVLNAIQMK